MELSKQIAYLQSEYDTIAAENQNLKSEALTKIERKSRSQKFQKPNIHFLKSVQAIKEKQLKELEKQYSEDLKFIRERYPRWKPNL